MEWPQKVDFAGKNSPATPQAEETHGPMSILTSTMSSLGNVGKHAQPTVGPLFHLSDEKRDFVLMHKDRSWDCLFVSVLDSRLEGC